MDGDVQSALEWLKRQYLAEIDPRALRQASIDTSKPIKVVATSRMNQRDFVRSLLQPLNLKLVVHDEGAAIVVDHLRLARQDIGTSLWVSNSEEQMTSIEEKLSPMIPEPFAITDEPLENVIDSFANTFQLPIALDRQGLDEIGISPEDSVTGKFADITVQDALASILRPLDLELTVQNGRATVTSQEQSELNLLTRIYYLEGTGVAQDNTAKICELIESSIFPDQWDTTGGLSTLRVPPSSRPGILVSCPLKTHSEIERLLSVMRLSHFIPSETAR